MAVSPDSQSVNTCIDLENQSLPVRIFLNSFCRILTRESGWHTLSAVYSRKPRVIFPIVVFLGADSRSEGQVPWKCSIFLCDLTHFELIQSPAGPENDDFRAFQNDSLHFAKRLDHKNQDLRKSSSKTSMRPRSWRGQGKVSPGQTTTSWRRSVALSASSEKSF